MKPFTAWVVVILAVGLLPADEAKSKWVKVSGKAAKFEGQFPAKPMEESGKDSTQFVLEREGGKVALLLQASDFPEKVDIENADEVKRIIDSARTAVVKLFKGGKLLTEKDLKFAKKYPARDIDIQHPELGIYHTRLIVTPTHLYQVVVLGPKDYQKSAEAKKFIESFKLTD